MCVNVPCNFNKILMPVVLQAYLFHASGCKGLESLLSSKSPINYSKALKAGAPKLFTSTLLLMKTQINNSLTTDLKHIWFYKQSNRFMVLAPEFTGNHYIVFLFTVDWKQFKRGKHLNVCHLSLMQNYTVFTVSWMLETLAHFHLLSHFMKTKI